MRLRNGWSIRWMRSRICWGRTRNWGNRSRRWRWKGRNKRAKCSSCRSRTRHSGSVWSWWRASSRTTGRITRAWWATKCAVSWPNPTRSTASSNCLRRFHCIKTSQSTLCTRNWYSWGIRTECWRTESSSLKCKTSISQPEEASARMRNRVDLCSETMW